MQQETHSKTYPNGVNLDNINGLVGAIKADAALGDVKFFARSEWQGGTKSEVTVDKVHANGSNLSGPERSFTIMVDEPAYLGGGDSAANPMELLAAGLCGCLTAGIATNAALFGTELERLAVEVTLDIDVHGVLGLNKTAQNGAIGLHYKVIMKGKDGADVAAMTRTKETIDRKSPVRNTLELPLKVTTEVVVE